MAIRRDRDVRAAVNASNQAARALFVKAGFVESGRIDNLDAADPEQVFFKAIDRPQGATG